MWKENLEKIGEVKWRFPKEKKGGMYVDSYLYGDDSIVGGVEDNAIQQLTNLAMLPGVIGSLAMPDIHTGYGVPIGGVGAYDYEEGIISVGAVGFDINCLHPDTRVYLANGAWKKIKDLARTWDNERIRTLDKGENKETRSGLLYFFSKNDYRRIVKIRLESGDELLVTDDHPILTTNGFVDAGKLGLDKKVIVNKIEGVEYKEPMKFTVVDEQEILEKIRKFGLTKGNAEKQILNQLKKRNLVHLESTDNRIPVLARIIGFVTGDGNISITQKTRRVSFYGKHEDLKELKRDLEELGFRPILYSRERNHKIKTRYGKVEFDAIENSLHVASSSFAVLLSALGAPVGNKTKTEFHVPDWIMGMPEWIKAQYLAGLFGAEMSSPRTVNKFNFNEPVLGMNKSIELEENLIQYLEEIRSLLADLGITTSTPRRVDGYMYPGKQGETIGYRLEVHGNPENLIKLWSRVGFAYNKEKKELASLAVSYLKIKEKIKARRELARGTAREMYNSGAKPGEIISRLSGEYVTASFIKHSIWSNRGDPRINPDFVSFHEFMNERNIGDGYLWEKIESIEIQDYSGEVYDLTTVEETHNFLANGVVVSNCGIYTLKTNLTEEDVRPKLEELMDALYEKIPAGVGSHSKLKLSQEELDLVLENGVDWLVEKGMLTNEDKEHMEEEGRIEGADASKVSDKAKKRGRPELGTLGAGNHFLEVQVVRDVYDEEIARRYGLFKDQVLVMIHSGSRGVGHQVATDYLQIMNNAMKRYNLSTPDRQLVYLPAQTQEAQDYLSAMNAAANFGFANRALMASWAREAFEDVFKKDWENLGMKTLYQLCHNILKLEEYEVNGEKRKLWVHRKGATRSLGPGNKLVPKAYRDVGQPVLIAGSMGTSSYILAGTRQAEEETFGSTCHGAGRQMSRHEAIRKFTGDKVKKELANRGIVARASHSKVLAEEAPNAYKNVDLVIDSVARAGISRKIARVEPLGVVKG